MLVDKTQAVGTIVAGVGAARAARRLAGHRPTVARCVVCAWRAWQQKPALAVYAAHARTQIQLHDYAADDPALSLEYKNVVGRCKRRVGC
jgi:hypothetical protein